MEQSSAEDPGGGEMSEDLGWNPVAEWTSVLKTRCKKQLGELSREYPHKRSLFIDYQEVQKAGHAGLKLADEIIKVPSHSRDNVRDAIIIGGLIKTQDGKPVKDLNIRFFGINKKSQMRDLRYEDVNHLITLDVVVLRASEVRPRITDAVFKCGAGHFTPKHQGMRWEEPNGCGTDGCLLRKLTLVPARSKFTNQQRLKVQENGEGLNPGQQPQTLDVIVTDDICDDLYVGDRASITGIVRATQRIVRGEKSPVFDLYLELVSIETGEREFEEIEIDEEAEKQIREIAKSGNAFDMISKSVAPTIWGMEDVKRAIALQLFGGVTKNHDDGQVTRAEIHTLLLGDYGIAKSQLAKWAARQSPRGIFISAVTASAAGLIGAATRDEDQRWVVDAGVLPLADKGIAAIDEIDKADKETLNVLYNVMEDGEVQISKAARRLLKARTSMIMCGNPKYQKFDMFADLIDQITIPPALVNRFDLLFILPDNKVNDGKIINHILKTNYHGECKAAGKSDKLTEDDFVDITPPVAPKLLKQYIAYAKANIHPIMNAAARQKIDGYYLKLRSEAVDDKTAPVTPRQAHSIVRLAEAAAKMRLSPEVTLKDADTAIEIFDKCIRAIATDTKTGGIDMGKIGQGTSQTKINLIGVIRDILLSEPKISISLLLAKLAERSYKDEQRIIIALDEAKRAGDIYEPKHEHYIWYGK